MTNDENQTVRIVFDPVSKPSHYCKGRRYEPVKVIEDWGLGFHLGNALKYIARAGRKEDEMEDLRKAIWYIQRYLEVNQLNISNDRVKHHIVLCEQECE